MTKSRWQSRDTNNRIPQGATAGGIAVVGDIPRPQRGRWTDRSGPGSVVGFPWLL